MMPRQPDATAAARMPDFAALPDWTALTARREQTAPTTAAGAGAEPEGWLTPEGIVVKPRYGEADLAGLDFVDTWPGLAPFVRGPYPTMYVNQPWTIRQYAGFSTARDSNAFYRRNLAAGQKGLSVAFDLAPTGAMTRTTRACPAMSAWPAWRSTASSTCGNCSTAFRSTR
jgi:hypothetical protein